MTELNKNFGITEDGANIKNNAYPYSSDALRAKFDEKKLSEFKKEMAQIREDVHPAFLRALDDYESKVYSLLKNNISVAADPVVQEEIATQNARIATKFVGDGITLGKAYEDIFS